MPNLQDVREKSRLSIIVPMCNEEDSLGTLTEKLLRLQQRMCAEYDVEYCLVDDGSHDNTRSLMATAVPSGASALCVHHEQNRGLGAAIRSGLEAASGAILCTIDADCSYTPEELHTLIEMVAEGRADIAVASPYHPQGAVVGVRRWRLLLSQQCSRLYRAVSPLKLYTYTSIFRAYSRAAVGGISFKSDGFVSAVEMLLSAQSNGFRVREVPMTLYARQHGYSKMRIAKTIAAHLGVLRREWLAALTAAPWLRPRAQARPAPAPLSVSFVSLEEGESPR